MRLRFPRAGQFTAATLALGLNVVSCTDGTTPDAVLFDVSAVTLDASLASPLTLRNAGTRVVGPIELRSGPVLDAGSASVPGARLVVTPQEVPTLAPGASVTVQLQVETGTLIQPGSYRTSVTAAVSGAEARATVSFAATAPLGPAASSLELVAAPTTLRQGDVAHFAAVARDGTGAAIPGAPISWDVLPAGSGFVAPDGSMVAYRPGTLTVRAQYGSLAARAEVNIRARALSGSATLAGEGPVLERHTSDLWLHGDYAYTGTWGQRTLGGISRWGDILNVWSLANATAPVLVTSLGVDARTVNDVKVRSDGTLAVLTHEGSNDGKNGVTFLSLANPAQPTVVSRYTQGLESGIHNAWLDGDYAYLVVDGGGNGLRILDVSDPAHPTLAASYYAGSSFLHDVYVRDGLAFLSHWNAGLVILDVGHGIAGGSPAHPVEVSRLPDLNGQTHNAWYWPEAGYVFVGEEDFQSPGYLHVVDVHDLTAPMEVATYRVPDRTPHNFWLDESSGVLYLAWYERGLRALDVTGALLGDLDAQGRDLFGVEYDGAGFGCATVDGTCAWAPQLHKGLLYVSDMNNGLVVLRPTF